MGGVGEGEMRSNPRLTSGAATRPRADVLRLLGRARAMVSVGVSGAEQTSYHRPFAAGLPVSLRASTAALAFSDATIQAIIGRRTESLASVADPHRDGSRFP